jgi:hypothetical protein
MKRISTGALTLALIVTVLAGASIAGAAAFTEAPPTEAPTTEASPESSAGEASLLAEGCSANVICIYGGQNYNNKWISDYLCSASGAQSLPVTLVFQSATNRCGNKTNWLRTNGTVVACMNPGGNRPSPGFFNQVFIAANYGAFC